MGHCPLIWSFPPRSRTKGFTIVNNECALCERVQVIIVERKWYVCILIEIIGNMLL